MFFGGFYICCQTEGESPKKICKFLHRSPCQFTIELETLVGFLSYIWPLRGLSP